MKIAGFGSRTLFAMSSMAFLVMGCVVDPSMMGRPTYVEQPGWDDGVPPGEYIQGGAPLYYSSEPGVAYYPVYVDFPGSCHCIMPVRYYEGVWYAPGNVYVYRGHFPFHHPAEEPRRVWLQNRGVFQGQPAYRGRLEQGADRRMRPVPPTDSGYVNHLNGMNRNPNSPQEKQGMHPGMPQSQQQSGRQPSPQGQAQPAVRATVPQEQQQGPRPGMQQQSQQQSGQPVTTPRQQQPVAQPGTTQEPQRGKKALQRCSDQDHEQHKC